MKILKSMVLALFVITASAVFATPIPSCSTTTLDVYLAQGYECSQGPLLFSDFSFSLVSSGDAAQPTASDVMVNVLGDGFSFLCLGSDFLPCFRAGDVNAPGEYSDVCPYELILTPDGLQAVSYPMTFVARSMVQRYLGGKSISEARILAVLRVGGYTALLMGFRFAGSAARIVPMLLSQSELSRLYSQQTCTTVGD
jgi:hypothetical protein